MSGAHSELCGVSPAGIWHCYWEYSNKSDSTSISDIGFTTNFNAYLQVKETWLAFCESDGDVSVRSDERCIRVWGACMMFCHMTFLSSVIIISVVEAILLLTLIFLRTRILIAIALIQESSK